MKLRKDFSVGENVNYLRNDKKWYPAKIIKENKIPRSYLIEDDNGSLYCRNKSFINPRPAPDSSAISSDCSSEYDRREPLSDKPLENDVDPNYDGPGIITKSGRTSKPPERYGCWLSYS